MESSWSGVVDPEPATAAASTPGGVEVKVEVGVEVGVEVEVEVAG